MNKWNTGSAVSYIADIHTVWKPHLPFVLVNMPSNYNCAYTSVLWPLHSKRPPDALVYTCTNPTVQHADCINHNITHDVNYTMHCTCTCIMQKCVRLLQSRVYACMFCVCSMRHVEEEDCTLGTMAIRYGPHTCIYKMFEFTSVSV